VANIVDDWPFIKQNPGASAREKKERCSITRYTSAPSKSMLFSYRRDAVPYQRDSKKIKSLPSHNWASSRLLPDQGTGAVFGRLASTSFYVWESPNDGDSMYSKIAMMCSALHST
jgi:hypothetical protein